MLRRSCWCPQTRTAGHFPDLTDCKSFRHCTVTTAPLNYITRTGLMYDPLMWNKGSMQANAQYLVNPGGRGTYLGWNGGCNWARNIKDDPPTDC